MAYFPPPRDLLGFPGFYRVPRKSPVRGGGSLRARWTNDRGIILEWDSRHQTIEMYNKRGRHLGEFDPISGEQVAAADPQRRIEP